MLVTSLFSLRAELGGEDSGDTGEERLVKKFEGKDEDKGPDVKVSFELTGVTCSSSLSPSCDCSFFFLSSPLNKFLLLNRFRSFLALLPILAKFDFLRGLVVLVFDASASRDCSKSFSLDDTLTRANFGDLGLELTAFWRGLTFDMSFDAGGSSSNLTVKLSCVRCLLSTGDSSSGVTFGLTPVICGAELTRIALLSVTALDLSTTDTDLGMTGVTVAVICMTAGLTRVTGNVATGTGDTD